MARAEITDPLQNFRFRIQESRGAGQQTFFDQAAGFTTVSIPEKSVESVTFRDNKRSINGDPPQKYPGMMEELDDITMERGLVLRDSKFFDWVKTSHRGGEYRTDFQILHYHRAATDDPAIIYEIKEALCTGLVMSSDLDADDSEVSIQEITISAEDITPRRKKSSGFGFGA